MTLGTFVALVEEAFQQLVAVVTVDGLFEGTHVGLVGGEVALGGEDIAEGIVDGGHPLILILLGSERRKACPRFLLHQEEVNDEEEEGQGIKKLVYIFSGNSPRKHFVDIQVLCVNKQKGIGPPRISPQPPHRSVIHASPSPGLIVLYFVL